MASGKETQIKRPLSLSVRLSLDWRGRACGTCRKGKGEKRTGRGEAKVNRMLDHFHSRRQINSCNIESHIHRETHCQSVSQSAIQPFHQTLAQEGLKLKRQTERVNEAQYSEAN